MSPSFKLAVAFMATHCLVYGSFAAEIVYTPPVIPNGEYRSMVPAAREDWLSAVQDKFNKTQGKHFDLVFDGGSFIADWDKPGRGLDVWNTRYAKLNATDFGINGDSVQNVLWRLQHGQMDGINPKMVILMVGMNNIPFDAPDKIANGIKVLIADYLKDAPNAKFLLMGAVPQGANATDPLRGKISQLNKLIASMADGKRVTYLDIGGKILDSEGSLRPELFAPDLVHPTIKLYELWADAMGPEIEKLFQQSPSHQLPRCPSDRSLSVP